MKQQIVYFTEETFLHKKKSLVGCFRFSKTQSKKNIKNVIKIKTEQNLNRISIRNRSLQNK